MPIFTSVSTHTDSIEGDRPMVFPTRSSMTGYVDQSNFIINAVLKKLFLRIAYIIVLY